VALGYYELRFLRPSANGEAEELPPARAMRCSLDLSDAQVSAGLLDRHLYAAADRAGLDRTQAHLLHVEVREVDRHQRVDREPTFRWVLPVLPEEES
jgi:hypothetical protein